MRQQSCDRLPFGLWPIHHGCRASNVSVAQPVHLLNCKSTSVRRRARLQHEHAGAVGPGPARRLLRRAVCNRVRPGGVWQPHGRHPHRPRQVPCAGNTAVGWAALCCCDMRIVCCASRRHWVVCLALSPLGRCAQICWIPMLQLDVGVKGKAPGDETAAHIGALNSQLRVIGAWFYRACTLGSSIPLSSACCPCARHTPAARCGWPS